MISIIFNIFFMFLWQQNWDQVVIKSEKLSDNLYVIYGAGGNIGLFTAKDFNFVIDNQFEPLALRILNKIDSLSSKEIKYVLNTHYHGDHSGSNRVFKEKNITIIAHENVRSRMGLDFFNDVFKREMKKRESSDFPILTFNDELKIYIDDEEILIKHLKNGHTDGDAIVHFKKANVIHCGDLYFSTGYPYVDISSGGSLRSYIENQEKIASLADDKTIFIAGHGLVSNKKNLVRYTSMIKNYFLTIEKAFKAGKNLDQIREMRITEKTDKVHGTGFINAETFVLLAFMTLEKELKN